MRVTMSAFMSAWAQWLQSTWEASTLSRYCESEALIANGKQVHEWQIDCGNNDKGHNKWQWQGGADLEDVN